MLGWLSQTTLTPVGWQSMPGLAEPDRPDPGGNSHLLHGADEFLLTLLFVFGFLQLLTQACHLCCHPLGFRTPGPHQQSTGQPCTINRSAMHNQQVTHAKSADARISLHFHAKSHNPCIQLMQKAQPCKINQSQVTNYPISSW